MAAFTIDTNTLSNDIVVIEINGSPQLFSADFATRQRQLAALPQGSQIGRKLWPPNGVGTDFPRGETPLTQAQRSRSQTSLDSGQPKVTSLFTPTTQGVENREPFAVREAGRGRNVPPVPVPFPELGSLRFRSAQSRRNMLPIERRAFENAVQRQGVPLEDFLEQEHRATSIGGPRSLRARFQPTRIRF